MATIARSRDTAIEREAQAWMNDPYEHFGHHNTRIHSLERAHVEAVQLAAMQLRFEERMGQVQMLKKLADGQQITSIGSFNDLAPLLMPHDVYKSYPVSLLAKQQFGKLNQWLGKLTRHDLSGVDVSIFYLDRPTPRSVQGVDHVLFWEQYFADQGASLTKVRHVFGAK